MTELGKALFVFVISIRTDLLAGGGGIWWNTFWFGTHLTIDFPISVGLILMFLLTAGIYSRLIVDPWLFILLLQINISGGSGTVFIVGMDLWNILCERDNCL